MALPQTKMPPKAGADEGMALFRTAVGECAIVWGTQGIRSVQLPGKTAAATRESVARQYPLALEASPPPRAQKVINAIVKSLSGASVDLSSVPLDMGGLPPFHQRVYAAARQVPAGSTVTYGQLAALAGAPGGARAVGQALGRNPFPIIVPCHRVLAAGGKMGGFSAEGGVATKEALLAIEGWAGPKRSSGRTGPLRALDRDAAAAYLCSADPVLARLIASIGPCGLEARRPKSAFGALARSIVYQQLNGRAASTIFNRLVALGADRNGDPVAQQILDSPPGTLREVGLSAAKQRALMDLAERHLDGRLPNVRQLSGMEDELVIQVLSEVRGVGRWTAEMFLIFYLGRPDVLPLGDYGLRRGFQLTFGLSQLPEPSELAQRGKLWSPFRSVASWYLWRAVDQPL